MRAILLGQDSRIIDQAARDAGFTLVEADPEVCICFGGDGTLLGAERDFPGIPKVPIRRRLRNNGDTPSYRQLLEQAASGGARVTHLPKLRARCRDHELLALNDVIVRNAVITSAVRFQVEIDGTEHFGEIVGDGLVVATPFGSSAYYRSITNSVIHIGIGLAFNNSTEPVTHLVLAPASRIVISITRGPALLAADNCPDMVELSEGDTIEVEQSQHEAVIWGINNLLCMDRASADNSRRLRWRHSSAAKAPRQ